MDKMMKNDAAVALTLVHDKDALIICMYCERDLRPADVVNRLPCTHVAHADCTILQAKKFGLARCKVDEKCFEVSEIESSDTFIMSLSALTGYGQKHKQILKKLRALEVKAARMEEELVESLYRHVGRKNSNEGSDLDAIVRQFTKTRLESLNARFATVTQRNIALAINRHNKSSSEDEDLIPITGLFQQQNHYFSGESSDSINTSPWFRQEDERTMEEHMKNSTQPLHVDKNIEKSILMHSSPLGSDPMGGYFIPSVHDETRAEDIREEADEDFAIASVHPISRTEKKQRANRRGSSPSDSILLRRRISSMVEHREQNELTNWSPTRIFSTGNEKENNAVSEERAENISPQGGLTSWSPNEGLHDKSRSRCGPFGNTSPSNDRPVHRSLIFTASLQNTSPRAEIRPHSIRNISPVQTRAPRNSSSVPFPVFKASQISEIECKETAGTVRNDAAERGSHQRIFDREVDSDDLSTLLSRRLREKRFHGMTLSGRTNTDPFNMYLMSKELAATPGSMRSPDVQGSIEYLERMRVGEFYSPAPKADNGFLEDSCLSSHASAEGYRDIVSQEYRDEQEHSCLDQECKDLKCLIGKCD